MTGLCPKCHHDMTTKRFGPKISVERCEHCAGLWCSKDALSEMHEVRMADLLDAGDPRRGEVYDEIRDVDCPGCGSRMSSSRHPLHENVQLEWCEDCEAFFFDAAELHSIAHMTVREWVQAIWQGRL